MKITKKQLQEIIKEEISKLGTQNLKSSIPKGKGFVRATRLPNYEEEFEGIKYEESIKAGGIKPKSYGFNNGVILAVDENFVPFFYISGEFIGDPLAIKETSFSEAKAALEAAGYKDGGLPVPYSTGY
tara:strand:- start:209 stop:592 length:384 start_codon:yes stop_codon:yes gene_type:complete